MQSFRSLVLLIVLSFAAPAAGSDDFQRYPEASARSAQSELDPAQIEQLKEMLRQAKALEEAAKKKAAEGAKAPAPAKAATAAEKDAGEGDEKKDEEEKEEEKPLTRPGCMYRGTTLIWEKVPGTCKQ
jgi:hypothetical protein